MLGGLFMLVMMAIIIVSIVSYRRAKTLEQQQQLPPGYGGGGFTPAGYLQGGGASGESNFLNLKLNDIVSYFGQDFIIEGRLNYWEDGDTWVTYMLVDGDEIKWLSVEDDDRLEVSLWEEIDDLHVQDPPPEFLEYRGERFRLVERGSARVNQQGRTRNKTGLHVDYYDYEGDDNMLSVEKWGGAIEVSFGQEIRPSTLEILPGDEVEY